MPDRDSPAIAVLETLGFALFSREASRALRLVGAAPAWLQQLWPELVAAGAELPVNAASPFLENFLIDAEDCWRAGDGRIGSGPWVERDATGADVNVEAAALTAAGQPVLLIERLGEVFEAKKLVLQKARENVIAWQRLNAELQKKEILLHCVAEDMTAALANSITALRLIELEQDPAQTRMLLGLASRGMEEQQSLIHKVLDVFADDLDGFYGRRSAAADKSNLRAVLRAAVEEIAPQFSEKGVQLSASELDGGEIPIAADAAHLQRVIANLLEQAVQNTPAGGSAAVRLDDDGDWASISVEDPGAAMTPNACTRLFAPLPPSSASPDVANLRLHFCRIAVENAGGEIGCEPRAGGGNRFWIRLPKARATSR